MTPRAQPRLWRVGARNSEGAIIGSKAAVSPSAPRTADTSNSKLLGGVRAGGRATARRPTTGGCQNQRCGKSPAPVSRRNFASERSRHVESPQWVDSGGSRRSQAGQAQNRVTGGRCDIATMLRPVTGRATAMAASNPISF